MNVNDSFKIFRRGALPVPLTMMLLINFLKKIKIHSNFLYETLKFAEWTKEVTKAILMRQAIELVAEGPKLRWLDNIKADLKEVFAHVGTHMSNKIAVLDLLSKSKWCFKQTTRDTSRLCSDSRQMLGRIIRTEIC